MKSHDHAASRRYARALLEVVLEKGDPGRVRDELRDVVRLLRTQAALQAALKHPALSTQRKKRLLEAIFGPNVSDPVRRLLALLAGAKRLTLLDTIAEGFAHLWNQRRGVLAAEVLSAAPLGPTEVERIRAVLRERSGREVEIATRVDASLLGGIVVTMDGRTYDGSMRSRLASLRQRLVGAPLRRVAAPVGS